MPPTLFGKELKYYSPHKDTKQRLTTQWAAADSQPNIWRCSKIQAASVLQHLKLFCCTAQPRSVLQLSTSSAALYCMTYYCCRNKALSQAPILRKVKLAVNFLDHDTVCIVFFVEFLSLAVLLIFMGFCWNWCRPDLNGFYCNMLCVCFGGEYHYCIVADLPAKL